MEYLLIPIFAILNRARGSKFFSLTNSTEIGRLASMLLMGISLALFEGTDPWQMSRLVAWTFGALMFWCSPAWDAYWGMAIGTTTALRAGFAPVDWIMEIVWPKTPTPGTIAARVWGAVAIGLRQSLAACWIVGLALLFPSAPQHAYFGFFTLLFGLPYLISGYVFGTYAVMAAEMMVGAGLGGLAILTLGG